MIHFILDLTIILTVSFIFCLIMAYGLAWVQDNYCLPGIIELLIVYISVIFFAIGMAYYIDVFIEGDSPNPCKQEVEKKEA